MKYAAILALLAINAAAADRFTVIHSVPDNAIVGYVEHDSAASVGTKFTPYTFATEAAAFAKLTELYAAGVTNYAGVELPFETYPTPEIVLPVVDSQGRPTGKTARLLIDEATMQPVITTNSASPIRPYRIQRAEAQALQTAAKAHRDALKAIKLDLDQLGTNINAIAISPVVVSNIVTTAAVWPTAAQRNVIIAIKDAEQANRANAAQLNDVKRALSNTQQALEKIRREIR